LRLRIDRISIQLATNQSPGCLKIDKMMAPKAVLGRKPLIMDYALSLQAENTTGVN
jgi:hypothetical protein